ncbi:MAG: DUF4040 domain-containing protein, partial [Gammaproteobacteria bacterium]
MVHLAGGEPRPGERRAARRARAAARRAGGRPIETLIDVFLLTLLAITAIAVVKLRSLVAAVMLSGIYSLISAGVFVVLDAVDVAFTEAAVG